MSRARISLLVLLTVLLSGIVRAAEPASAQVDPLREEFVQPGLGETIDHDLRRFATDGFSGAVFIERGGTVILHHAYGDADRERRIPNTVDTPFPIGSMTAQFTAAAVLRLEMEGKLDTNDPIGRYFEGLPPEKGKITIHHLLTHRAGFAVSATPIHEGDWESFIEAIRDAPIESAPGKQYRPFDAGYSLLAAVIERVSGQSFESYTKTALLEPAGMIHTRFQNEEDREEKLVARGYLSPKTWLPRASRLPLFRRLLPPFESSLKRRASQLRPAAPEPYDWGSRGARGLITTVGDLFRWELALRGNTLLSVDAKDKLFNPFSNELAYGWRFDRTGSGTARNYLTGELPGFQCSLCRYADDKMVTIVAANNDMGWLLPVRTTVEDATLHGKQMVLVILFGAILLFIILRVSMARRVPYPHRRRHTIFP